MSRSPAARKLALFAGLAVTLIASFWGGDKEISQPVERAERRTTQRVVSAPPATPVVLHSEKLHREAADWPIKDIFAARSWYVPPPPPKALPPPPPTAPPLPFIYIGKLEEEGRTTVFLAREGTNYSVKQGDQIDGVYRIDHVSAQAVVFTYLPLNIRQTLPIGASN